MMSKGVLSVFTRWKPHYPDLGVQWVYLEIGATSVTLKYRTEKHVIHFDSIEVSEAAGTVTARRNGCVVLHATAERT